MNWLDKHGHPEKYILSFFKWLALSAGVGAIGGLIGAAFFHVLAFSVGLRQEHSWLIYLLPVGGLVTVGLYKLFRLTGNRGTNEIIEAVLDDKDVSPLVAPAMFIATTMTQLFGGSSGREGAALQIGASQASALAKLLHLKNNERSLLIMSGMSAVFAGLFGTPLTACLFVLEFEAVGTFLSPALLPCFLSAFTASRVSLALGAHPETFALAQVSLSFDLLWRVALLALLIALLDIAMCFIFHKAEHFAHKFIENPWLRILAGSAVIIIMTLLAGDQRFNGAGMDLAIGALEGHTDWYNFILKLLFTAITLAAGFKGGEIVPTFAIGATFGCVVGGLLGLDPGFAAAVGLVGLFCGGTNAPLASIVLSIEMFGGANLHIFAMVCVLCFVLSGQTGLYSSQILRYSKISRDSDEYIKIEN